MIVNFKDIGFDQYNKIETPTLILKTMDDTIISSIGNYFNLKATFKLNDISEFTFSVPAYNNGVPTLNYDRITGNKIINIEPFGDFITSNPETVSDGVDEVKNITAYSLEYVFTTKTFYIPSGTYKFFDPLGSDNDSIINILLENMPGWSIGTVDTKLYGRYRTFESEETNLYQFMINTLQESYNCLFIFDTKKKKVNVIEATTGISNLPIYLSYDNLVKSIRVKELSDEVVTCLSVRGAEPVDISYVNPTGNSKIYNLDYYIANNDLSDDLISKWVNWDSTVEKYRDIFSVLSISMQNQLSKFLLLQASYTTLKGKYDEYENLIQVDLIALEDTVEDEIKVALEAQIEANKALKAEVQSRLQQLGTLYSDSDLIELNELNKVVLNDMENYNSDNTNPTYQSLYKESLTNIVEYIYSIRNVVDEIPITIGDLKILYDELIQGVGSLNEYRLDYLLMYQQKEYIVNICKFDKFFTDNDLEKLSMFFKEESLTEETFVINNYNNVSVNDSSAMLNIDNKAIVNIQGVDIEPVNKFNEIDRENLENLDIDESVIDFVRDEVNDSSKKVLYNFNGGIFNLSYNQDEKNYNITGDVVNISFEYNTDNLHSYEYDENNIGYKTDYFLLNVVLNNANVNGDEQGTINITMQGELFNVLSNKSELGFNIKESTIFISGSVTDYQQRSICDELLAYGIDKLEQLSSPSFEFNIESGNFIFSKQFEPFRKAIELGKSINLGLGNDITIKPIIVEISVDYDNLDDFSLLISSKFRSSSSEFQLVDLLGEATATGSKVDLNKYNYSAYKETGAGSALDSYINNAYDVARQNIINSNNQSVEWNKGGLFLRKSKLTGGFEDEQVGMVNNTIAFTDDSWDSVKLAIGKFNDKNTGDTYGIVAPYIMGTLLAGKNLVIENKKENSEVMQFKVDESGVFLNNASFVLQRDYTGSEDAGKMLIDPRWGLIAGDKDLFINDGTDIIPNFIDENGHIIWDIDSPVPEHASFFIDSRTGKAYFKGDIYAETGYFSEDVVIHGKSIIDGTIEGIKLGDATITGDKIGEGEVSGDNIADESVTNDKVKDLSANKITTGTLKADVMQGNVVSALNLNAGTATINEALISELNASKIVSDTAWITSAMVKNLSAEKITTGSLSTDVLKAYVVDAINANIDNLNANKISSDMLIVNNGYIKNQMIDNLDVSKINAGTISTNKFDVQSDDGGFKVVGNTTQWTDRNNKVRMQAGRDGSGNFNFAVFGTDGTTTYFDETGIKSAGVPDGIINNKMVSDTANISVGKLNISSLFETINNDSTHTLKSSRIVLDETGQSLNVAFNSMITDLDTVANSTQSSIATLRSDFTIEQGAIRAEVAENYYNKGEVDEQSSSLLINAEEIVLSHTQDLVATEDLRGVLNELVIDGSGFGFNFSKIIEDINNIEEKVTRQESYIRLSNGEIIIGKDGEEASPVVAKFTNDTLKFEYDGVTVASFTNEELVSNITRVDVKVSYFDKWDTRRGVNGSLNDVWIGG